MAEFEIGIFGAGVWGTALACAWARAGNRVALWGHTPEKMREMAATRLHPRLNGVPLTGGVHPVEDPMQALGAPVWVSCLPVQASAGAWRDLIAQAGTRPPMLLHSSKGLVSHTHQTVSQALGSLLEMPVGTLSGPTFADEVAKGLPAALVLAVPDVITDFQAMEVQRRLATERLRLYLSRDVVGAELCGALKNVLAIAAGLVEQLGLGHNARAALITRGLAEMARLVEARGGRSETVMGLAGMGDLLLTATGPQSRNRRLGAALAQGMTLDEAIATLGGQVAEGVPTTRAALDLGKEAGVDLPITEAVARLLDGDSPASAVERLMNRSLKSE